MNLRALGQWLATLFRARLKNRTRTGTGPRVLLAEDEPAIRWLLADALRKAGYTVFEAKNGVEAFDLASSIRDVHLLLTDVRMPRMDGQELGRRLTKVIPSLRVLYISGYCEREEIDPAAVFLAKPFDKSVFLRTVEHTLAGTMH